MHKTVVLVGHCGADSGYLRLTVKKAIGDAHIVNADDAHALSHILEKGEPDLILFNRELGYGFEPNLGVDVIRKLHRSHPNLKMILVTNYDQVQKQAQEAGALPGFGKRELGQKRVLDVLKSAIGAEEAAPSVHPRMNTNAHE